MRRTLIVPAAGAGTRLMSEYTKALTPIAGKPMLGHVLDRCEPFADQVVIVAAEDNFDDISRYLLTRERHYYIEVQRKRAGMLDALRVAEQSIEWHRLMRVWIAWCDQVLLSARTVDFLADVEARVPRAAVILPTTYCRDPYTHVRRDMRGNVTEIALSREGDSMPPVGECDAGLFSLSPQAFEGLFRVSPAVGAVTGESNFLPLLPRLGGIATIRVEDPDEVRGVNTPADLVFAESRLRS